jgi:hypothetical protein
MAFFEQEKVLIHFLPFMMRPAVFLKQMSGGDKKY